METAIKVIEMAATILSAVGIVSTPIAASLEVISPQTAVIISAISGIAAALSPSLLDFAKRLKGSRNRAESK